MMNRLATTGLVLLGMLIPAARAADTVELKNVRVGGVRLIALEDQKKGIRPFNWPAGFTVSLIGDLPEAAMSVQAGEVDKAVADTGQSLLSEKQWDRRISFPRLSKDRKQVIFEAKMKVPGQDVRGLKELSGTLSYLTSSGTKETDLGTLALKKGTKGSVLGAEIVSVGPSKWQKNKQELQLKLQINKDAIKEIRLSDADGKPLPAKRTSASYSSNWVQLGLTRDQPFPESARIQLTLHDNLKKQVVRFTLKDITLAGRPLKK